MKNTISNHQIVTLAVFLLGGDIKPVDTEDVAVKADELAPGKYRWRKHPDQINLELVRTFLSDAKKEKNGALVEGTGNRGWQLTRDGLRLAKSLSSEVASMDLSGTPLSVKEKAWRKAERTRLLNSDAYTAFLSGGIGAVTPRDIDSFFRLNDYIDQSSRARKVNRIYNAFVGDSELGVVLESFTAIALNITGDE